MRRRYCEMNIIFISKQQAYNPLGICEGGLYAKNKRTIPWFPDKNLKISIPDLKVLVRLVISLPAGSLIILLVREITLYKNRNDTPPLVYRCELSPQALLADYSVPLSEQPRIAELLSLNFPVAVSSTLESGRDWHALRYPFTLSRSRVRVSFMVISVWIGIR